MRKYLIIMTLFLLPLCTFGRTLKIGVPHFDPPFVIQLDVNHFDGFDVAMIHYLCKKLDYDCELVAYKRDKLLKAVESGEVDIGNFQDSCRLKQSRFALL